MSPHDVPPDEMDWDPASADGALAGFVQELREAYPAQAPAAEDAHLAAMLDAARLPADNGDPVVRPVSNAAGPATQASGLPKQRRNHMDHTPGVKRIWTKVAVPIAAIFLVLGAVAAAGALPRGAQRFASHTAGLVGLDVPSGDDEGTETQDDGAIDDDQGEDSQGDESTDDDQGDQNDQGEQGEDDQDSTDETSGGNGSSTEHEQDGDDQGENEDGDSEGSSHSDDGDSQGSGSHHATTGGSHHEREDDSQDEDSQDEDSNSGNSGPGSEDGDSQD